MINYLKTTKMKGITLDPEGSKIFKMYADTVFCGNWNFPITWDNPSTAKSRTSYAILYSVCLIMWRIKIQTQIALYTTEAEYIALTYLLHDKIPMMQLLREMKGNGLSRLSTSPEVHCQSFKDKSGALELAHAPKMGPRTKHINQVYHHFRDFVQNGKINILR